MMRITRYVYALIISLIFFQVNSVSAQEAEVQDLPSARTLKTMLLVNKYFMMKWPDPGKVIVTDRERPSNIWTRAVYYEGLMALYKINPNEAFVNYTLQWGQSHNWSMRDGVKTRNADNQCCGQTYI
ncbi:MAG: glycoside hydrolase family 88 protein, partial [Chloroflexota bacterium]